jgi:HEAT repeat protein
VFLEDLAAIMIWLLALVLGLNAVFFLFMIFRRFSRQRFFLQKDAARDRFQPVVQELSEGTRTLEQAASVLALGSTKAEREAIYQLITRGITADNWERFSEVLYLLGFVEEWARDAFGKREGRELLELALKKKLRGTLRRERGSNLAAWLRNLRLFAVNRAIAVAHLGKLAPAYAQPFLAKALEDHSVEVRRVAVACMGRNRFREAVPLLVSELMRAMQQGNDVSLRTMKAALIQYRLEDLGEFVEHIRHSERRGRFFVVDSIRQICERAAAKGTLGKNDFPSELYDLLLDDCASDEFEDVRARTAAIIRYFRDERATAVLRKLLRDENEFVRLHSVRACSDPYFVDLIPDLISRLTDVKWRVREAAVATLNRMGTQAREELYRFFIECTDQFASEQISEELQRMGVLSELVATIAQGGDSGLLAQSVADKLVALGKTSVLLSTMAVSDSSTATVALIEALASNPQMEYVQLLEQFSLTKSGQVQAKAKQILRRLSGHASGTSGSALGVGGGAD